MDQIHQRLRRTAEGHGRIRLIEVVAAVHVDEAGDVSIAIG